MSKGNMARSFTKGKKDRGKRQGETEGMRENNTAFNKDRG